MLWHMSMAAVLAMWLSVLPVRAAGPDPTQFGVAIELGDIRSATKWLDEGLDADFEADRIGTGLMIGAWEGNIAMMELFLSRGADINRVSRIGEQALQLAAWKGRLEAVKWLLERGADINRTGKQWGALHYAALAGDKQIVQLLIGRGADVNARTSNDSTALMMAARAGHEELARMLLEAGADPKPVNDWGDSALTWAMRYGHPRIAKLVVPPAEFAQAVQAPPETFGTPTSSIDAPPELEDILRQMRLAQAEGRPVDDLRKALFEAVAAFRTESRTVTVEGKPSGKTTRRGAPNALVITAKRQRAGSERAELVYERKQAGAPRQPTPADMSDILQQMRLAKAKGRPVDDLRKALFEAIDRFKKESGTASAGEGR